MLLYLILAVLCFYSGQTDEEFANFKTILKAVHDQRVRPRLEKIGEQLGRQADPCRIESVTGRLGNLPNSAKKALTKIEDAANSAGKRGLGRRANPRRGLVACKEALKYSKNKALNVEICGKALAQYRNQQKDGVGRGQGSAWDELYGALSESMTTEEILAGLDVWNPASLGLLIDNTGSMADDIDQVKKIAESFLKTGLYYDQIIYNFVIMTFGDPGYQEPTSYYEPTAAVKHIDSKIVAAMGGDCPEMTCQALEQIINYSDMFSDSPMFVFTDASSKDCNEKIISDLEGFALSYGDTFNFVLTGTCDGTVDGNFTRLASSTGGSIYRLSEDEIYKLTDIVVDATESSSVIGYDHMSDDDDWEDYDRSRNKRDTAGSDHLLLRKKRQAGYSTLSFYVDETVGRLTMQVTFENLTDRRRLEGVKMSPVSPCSTAHEESGQRFGNIVHYAVDCPCLGEWQVKIPYSIKNKWIFTAKTFGEFTIAFDVMFEQSSSSNNPTFEKTKVPCAGDSVTLWVTIHQDEFIDDEMTTQIILRGDAYHEVYTLTKDRAGNGQWYNTIMVIPEVPFSVAVRGTTVGGNTFLRLLNTEIRPTATCLTTIYPMHMTIKAGGESLIIMSLKNKYEPKNYRLYCFNNRRGDGFQTEITRPRNRVHRVTEPDRQYYIYIKVKAPLIFEVGKIVNVKCIAKSDDDTVYKSYDLMVSSVYD